MDADFERKIMALIARAVPGKFRKAKISKETHLQKELGLDSIGVLSLVFHFEEAFGIDIAETGAEIDIAKLKSVGDIIDAGRNIMSRVHVQRES
jgi:acyl carrier protein